ncbi:MAG: gluconeogenesis factor YvcK family protein, partial [Succiniclasticum sp.]
MGWISWLCPGIQLKRWLLLFTVGVIVCAFSLALLFNNQVMGMAEELLFRLSYLATGEYGNGMPLVLGIVGMLLGIGIMIYAVRRIVRSIVEAVSPESSDSLMETIFVQRKLNSGPAITVVGGGTGLSTLLRGMKYITGNCTAVVTVGDDGGSSGRLRQELGIIPPGDLRKCLVAMADREPLMERVMQYRFEGDSSLAGHSLGNLFLAAIAETEGGMEEGLNAASQILKVRGHVIPSTLHSIQLAADMTDGSFVLGQAEIAQARKTVQRLRMVPEDVPATKSAVEAIRQADILVFGPGSLYTSVICNLLVPDIGEAVLQSRAVKIYVCNVMTQPGETDGFGAYEHVKTLTEYAGKPFL